MTADNRRLSTTRRLVGLASTAFALPVVAAVGSWSTTGPYGGSVTAMAVYEAAPNTIYAVGGGGVFRSAGSGSSW